MGGMPPGENVTSTVKKEPKLLKSPSTQFKSFLVNNSVPQQPRKTASQLKKEKADKTLIDVEDWFTLRKFELKNKQKIEVDPNIVKKLKKYMEKQNDGNFVELDMEKALILAQNQNVNFASSSLQNQAGKLAEHQLEKELFFSCYITGMKAHIQATYKNLKSHQRAKIQQELVKSDTNRSDIKRVLMRFVKDQQMGFRLEQN